MDIKVCSPETKSLKKLKLVYAWENDVVNLLGRDWPSGISLLRYWCDKEGFVPSVRWYKLSEGLPEMPMDML